MMRMMTHHVLRVVRPRKIPSFPLVGRGDCRCWSCRNGKPVRGLIIAQHISERIRYALADVPGAFTYAPLAGAVLDAGLQPLGVTFVPTDSTNYLGATGSQNLLVNPATATVTLSALTPTFDGSPKSVGVTTTPSGLSIRARNMAVASPSSVGFATTMTSVTCSSSSRPSNSRALS